MKQTLLVLAITHCSFLAAQPYNFSQTTSTYSPLSGETVLTTGTPWTYASAFTIPIGFTYNFMGSTFTTVYVEGSGFAYFDNINYYYLALPFTVKLKSKGSSGNNSPISYKLDGVAPNRILKVQWENAGFHYDTTSTINFQMWLYETSNILEVRIGPNSVPNPSVVYQENGSDGPVIGVYEFNSSVNCTYSNCLSGAPASATSNNPTGNINLFGTSLNGTPADGTVYVFDPNMSSISESNEAAISFFPNPADDRISFVSSELISDWRIYSPAGTLVAIRQPEQNTIDVSFLTEGIYFMEFEVNGLISRQKLVISRQ